MKKLIAIFFVAAIAAIMSSSVRAAESGGAIETVAAVDIYEIKLVSQEGSKFTVSFDIHNQEGVQPQIKYAVQLIKREKGGALVVDEKVYDETLVLRPNETVHKKIAYEAPEYLSGKYELWAISRTENAMPLGQGIAGEVNLKGNGEYVQIIPDSCYLKVDEESSGKHYTLDQGVDISQEESLVAVCDVKNNFESAKTVTPEFTAYRRTTFGKVSAAEKQNSFIIDSGATENISLTLPKAQEPQAYDVVLRLLDDSGKLISNQAVFHYVLRGVSGTIQNIRLDKDYYAQGEQAKIFFYWTGSADRFPGARGGTTKLDGVSVLMSIKSAGGGTCAANNENKIRDEWNGQVVNFNVNIAIDCPNPQVTAALKDAKGALLDKADFSIKSQRDKRILQTISEPEAAKKSRDLLSMAIAIGIAILLVGILRIAWDKKRNMSNGLKLLFIFAAASLWLASSGLQAGAATFVVRGPFPFSPDGYAVTPGVYAINLDKPAYTVGEQPKITAAVNAASNCSNGGNSYKLDAKFHSGDRTPVIGGGGLTGSDNIGTPHYLQGAAETVSGTYAVDLWGYAYGVGNANCYNNNCMAWHGFADVYDNTLVTYSVTPVPALNPLSCSASVCSASGSSVPVSISWSSSNLAGYTCAASSNPPNFWNGMKEISGAENPNVPVSGSPYMFTLRCVNGSSAFQQSCSVSTVIQAYKPGSSVVCHRENPVCDENKCGGSATGLIWCDREDTCGGRMSADCENSCVGGTISCPPCNIYKEVQP